MLAKKLSVAVLAVFAASAVLVQPVIADEDWQKIRIATEGAYAPWNFTDASGNLVGFELDLARDLCARMNVECEIVAQTWDGMIPALQARKFDAIMAGMSITAKRQEVINFSRAYARTPAAFVVTKSHPLAAFTEAVDALHLDELDTAEQSALAAIKSALSGKTIGVQVATTHANFLTLYMAENAEIQVYDTQENVDLDLAAGRIDAALASMAYWAPLLDSDKGKDLIAIGPTISGTEVFGEGIGVGMRQEDENLLYLFNAAIAGATEDGTVEKLAEQWFGFDASASE